MTEPVIRFEPASTLASAELTELCNRAYEAYFVPMTFTEAALSHHLRRSGVELNRSLVGRIDGELFGVSVAAIRGQRAWIGGFGVAAEHRRKGLAARMMDEHMVRLDLSGVAETGLEVIDRNPARGVYHRAGFAERGGALLALAGKPQATSAASGVELDMGVLREAHQRLPRHQPLTWRRELPTLEDDLRNGAHAVGLVRDGVVSAFAVVQETPTQMTLLDAATVDVEAGHALLDILANRTPGSAVSLVDEPQESPLAQAMREAGFKVALTQVAMVRPHGGKPA